MKKPSVRDEKTALRKEWSDKFLAKIEGTHKRNKAAVVTRILKRADTTKAGLVARSKKYDVECQVTVEDLRELLYDAYGKKCKYCHKMLVITNIVIDHVVPISKGGSSNRENLQVICKTSNCMKGSLIEDHFHLLLDWLETVPEELKKDISIRLSRGIH